MFLPGALDSCQMRPCMSHQRFLSSQLLQILAHPLTNQSRILFRLIFECMPSRSQYLLNKNLENWELTQTLHRTIYAFWHKVHQIVHLRLSNSWQRDQEVYSIKKIIDVRQKYLT